MRLVLSQAVTLRPLSFLSRAVSQKAEERLMLLNREGTSGAFPSRLSQAGEVEQNECVKRPEPVPKTYY